MSQLTIAGKRSRRIRQDDLARRLGIATDSLRDIETAVVPVTTEFAEHILAVLDEMLREREQEKQDERSRGSQAGAVVAGSV